MSEYHQKKTWFLAPTWEIPPSAIRLGYLIADPTEPRYPLNPAPNPSVASAPNNHPPPIDTEIFLNEDQHGFNMELSGESSTKLGLWAEFLQVVGLTAEVKLKRSKEMITTYSVQEARTEWFSPSTDFVRYSVNTKEVADFLDMAGFKRSLYMIVGVKSVAGASISMCHTKEHSINTKFGFDGMMAGVPISSGPQYGHTTSNGSAVEYKKAGPIVFAYQLIKIKLKSGNSRATPYSKGAMFEAREHHGNVTIDVELSDDVSDIQPKKKKDGPNKKGVEFLESYEEGSNEECLVVVPTRLDDS